MTFHETQHVVKGILFVSNIFSVGADYGGLSIDLANRLITKGWKVNTVSSSANRFMRPIDMFLSAMLKLSNYDVALIDVFSGSAFRWAESSAWILRRLGKPIVLTLHGGNLPDFSSGNSRRVRELLSSATVVTAPSGYLIHSMRRYRADIRLIPNPIELSEYKFRHRDPSSPSMLYLRALHKIYNPQLAVEVLQRLKSDYPRITLRIVGPDKKDGTFESLKERVEHNKLQGSVNIEGAVSKTAVPATLDQADIFLNTTNYDNTPVSVIEAMASGMCIVSTNVGGIPFLLEHGHDALLVPPNDPDAMAHAVRRILTEPELAATLSNNARKTASQFDWSVVFPQWEQLLKGVIHKHRGYSDLEFS